MKTVLAFVLALVVATAPVHAGLLVDPVTPVAGTVGPYAMTAFDSPEPVGGSVTSATSAHGHVVRFTTKNGAAPQPMTVGDATSAPWWDGATSPFYKAVLGDVTWVELWMPENTFAFSMTLDASATSRAWLLAVDDGGRAVDTAGARYDLTASGDFDPSNPPFDIRLTGAPRSFGFHADRSGGACTSISKVVVDPHYWAMGDFSIHVAEAGCGAEVPEPGVPILLGAAAGVAALRRRRRRT